MRIGVDATSWANTRGYGRHTRSLVEALVRLDPETQYTLVADTADRRHPFPRGAEVRMVDVDVPAVRAASADGRRSLVDAFRVSRALADPAFDLLLFPTIYTFVPVVSRARKLVTIHDVIAETHPELALPGRRARLLWRLKAGAGRRQADVVVTASEYSRRRLLARFALAPERVVTVGLAADPVFRPLPVARPTPRLRDAGLDDSVPLVVYVGGFGPHKNLRALLTAFAALTRARPATRLVLVGEHEREVFASEHRALAARIADLGLGARTTFTGYLPDEDLAALLNFATVLVLPSLMEGFGLPAVEAAACGCPVIATTESPLPELLGAGGRFVDPRDTGALTEALLRVVGSETMRAEMRAAGLAAARGLTWEGAARDMMAIMRRAVAV